MLPAFIGIISALVSGVLNGSFAAPMKRTVKWEWENIWLIWAVWALIIMPLVIAFSTVPELFGVYRQTPSGVLVRTFLFGLGWGLGAITFGKGLHMVGLSLGFSIIIGITAVTGALIPMLIFSPATILTPGGLVIIVGMLVTIAGVAFCGVAGMIKEAGQAAEQGDNASRSNFKLGFLVCLVSGIFNAMLNLAFVFGAPIAEVAKEYVAGPTAAFRAGNAIWVLALAGAFVTNLGYCGWLMLRRGTWKNYTSPQTGTYWFWAFLMGTLWFGGVALYGAGASTLGKLGTTVAWIILMATSVLVGNVWGILSGEWKDAPKTAYRRMAQGLILLIGSIILVSLGQYMLN